jgi:protease-4
MSMEAELIADRRRLRGKLSFWRVSTILVLLLAVIGLGLAAARRAGMAPIGTAQVARISVGGLIAGNQRMADLFKQVSEASSVAGVVVSISSPGGTTTGAEELYRNIRALSAKKPTVAFVDGTAASGGYITALGADHIVARETSLVGSIGVLLQMPNFERLMSKVGVSVEEIKSSPLKAEPNPFHTPSPEARAAIQSVIDNTYGWFQRLVAERRHMSPDELAAVSDGRVFNGLQALSLKLVDELGGEREAIAWLEQRRGVAKDLPVRDWKPRSGSGIQLWTLAAAAADLAGWADLALTLRQAGGVADMAKLDGLLALWHPGFSAKVSSELR